MNVAVSQNSPQRVDVDGAADQRPIQPASPVPQFLPMARKPLLTIRATSGWKKLHLRELWHFRDLTFVLAARDVKLRYRQTLLGAIWVVLQPLLAAGVFSFIFGKVAKLPSDNVPYFLFSYAGLLGWNVFNATVGKVNSSMVGNAHLITKIYFPRLTLALSTLVTTYLDFAIAMILMAILLFANRQDVPIGPGLLLLPLWLLLLTALAMGIGLLTAAFTVRYRDVGQVLAVGLQFLLYLSPVAYPASQVPQRFLPIYLLNPVSTLLEAFRWSLLGRTGVHWHWMGYAVIFSVLTLLVGAFTFKRLERTFVDVI